MPTREPQPPLLPSLSSLFSQLVSSSVSFTHIAIFLPWCFCSLPAQPSPISPPTQIPFLLGGSAPVPVPPRPTQPPTPQAWGLMLDPGPWSVGHLASPWGIALCCFCRVAPSRLDSRLHPPVCISKGKGEAPTFAEHLICARHHVWHFYTRSLIESYNHFMRSGLVFPVTTDNTEAK